MTYSCVFYFILIETLQHILLWFLCVKHRNHDHTIFFAQEAAAAPVATSSSVPANA
jgi:hypothetical protein